MGDGAALMLTVFSQKSPILAFNDLVDRTDEDEQQGMMFLFAGMALAVRNPRSHALDADSPEAALDALSFLSLLMKRLDAAKLVKPK